MYVEGSNNISCFMVNLFREGNPTAAVPPSASSTSIFHRSNPCNPIKKFACIDAREEVSHD